MIRHPEYTRARIAQVGDRIRALVYAERRAPDRLVVAGPVGRIPAEDAERGRARLRVGVPFVRAARANLLEDEEAELPVTGGEIVVDYRPHQIATVLVH